VPAWVAWKLDVAVAEERQGSVALPLSAVQVAG
jgi:hypothetical protein